MLTLLRKALQRARPRKTILEAFYRRCEYCGVTDRENPVEWHIDHIIARVNGGSDEPDNLTLSCAKCNLSKRVREYIGPVRSLAIMLQKNRRGEVS
jgi:5-methylcytosine-specific restriction endonuclease McrA